MVSTGKDAMEAATLNTSGNTALLHDSSAVTQGTERTDARLSSIRSMRSRALSSLLSTSTAAVLTPLEVATARGPWALFCFRVRDNRLSRALLIATVLFDFFSVILEACNMAPPALMWASRVPLFCGFICVVVTGAGSRGLWSSRQAYLRSLSGWLDTTFLCNIAADMIYCLGVDAGWWVYTPAALAVFAVLRNLRAWVVLRICRTSRAAIGQLARTANDLAAVCLFVLVFSVLVLIVLMHFYGFACWYRCYPDLPLPAEVQASDSCSAESFFWDIDESQFRFCSENKSPCKEGTTCRNLFLYSVTSSCSAEERRRLQDRAWFELQANEEAAFGVLGLQTLGSAAVTLLQGFTLEGWAITMQHQVDGDHRSNGWVAYVAFPAVVVVGGMLLMNLGIAVLWEAFDAGASEQTARPSILSEAEWRVYQLLGTDWIKYLMVQLSEQWESIQKLKLPSSPTNKDADNQPLSGTETGLKQKLRARWFVLKQHIDTTIEMQFPELMSRVKFFFKDLTNFAFRVATHRLASPMMLIVVAIDMTCLLVESGTGSGLGFTIVYIITSAIFVAEATVLVLAFGRRGLKDGFICLDIMTACLAVVDGVLALSLCPTLSGCRAAMVNAEGLGGTVGVALSLLRPCRVFKVVKYFSTLRMTAEMLWVLQSSLLQYLLLIFYSCAVMAQLGLLLFFDPKYLSVHAQGTTLSVTKYFNFESPGNALLLLLTIMTGEGWDLFFKEFAQVYGGDLKEFTFDSGKLSDVVLTASFRVSTINSFLYIGLLFLNCLIFNFFGAIMIGHFIQTQKSLTVKYAARFIATCRDAGIAMPVEDALQGQNAQALYTRVDMTTAAQRDELIKAILFGADHGKSAKALGEFARKTSLALGICKTVARKGSRVAARASSGSILWTAGRQSTRSNSGISLPSDKPETKSLMGETDFDRAVAVRGLRQRIEQGGAAAHFTKSAALQGHAIGSVRKTSRPADKDATEKAQVPSTSLSLDELLVKATQVDPATKTAVQFAARDQTVILPDSKDGSKAFSARSRGMPDEDLHFKELCNMLWSALKDALRQSRIAMTAASRAGLSRLTPTDPDSPALQMAYMNRLVSDAYEVSKYERPNLTRQCNGQQSRTQGISSLADLGNKSGSNASITLRRRSGEQDTQQHRKGRQLPTWMQPVVAKQRAACAHLRNVCGISGVGWVQLILQTLSFVELVVECAQKKDISSSLAFGYLELGFQSVLTADVLLRMVLSFTSEGIPFFASRSNCWDLVLQCAAWCSLAVPFWKTKKVLDALILESAWYRFAQCTRILRSVWLLCLWKGTGTHRLALALQVACRRILDLGFIFILLVTFFAVDFRYLLESVAGDPPPMPLPHANLTSLGESFLSVFILTTSEGWPRVLTEFLDLGTGHRTMTIVLCSLVVSLLSVFVLNLFVGVIVDVLDKEQTNLEYTGGVRSAMVLRWNEVQRAIFSSNGTAEVTERRGAMVRGERFGARDWLTSALTSKQLDVAVAIVSLASCLTMVVTGAWAETDVRWFFPTFQTWIFWTNAVIVALYAIEQCLRVLVFKKAIFQKTIYVVDLAIAASSVVALIVGLSKSLHTPFPAEPLWPVAFRMVRVAYVVCQRLPVMRVISITMLNVAGALGRVLLLLAAIILFYGLIGTCLFFDAPISPRLHSTFASLFDTIILLMSCCTGENWHDIMLQGRAFYYERGSIGLGWLIVAYAVTFVVMAFLLLMNVFMSTVLKGYVDTKRNQSLWRVAQQHQELLNKWRLREMKLSWLPIHVAVQVLTDIAPPIGFKNQYVELGSRRMSAILASLAAYSLPVHNNNVHIRDVVLTTTCRACEAHAQRKETLARLDPYQQQQKAELNPRLVGAWMNRFSELAGLTPEFNILQYLAALQIQAFWRTQKLLQRNNTADQLLYMKHLLFLLETSAPICARKPSRTDSRRSTLRRKRGTKTGGSFAHRSTAMTRMGTFARSVKASQQPREKLKSIAKQTHRGVSPSSHQGEQKGSVAEAGGQWRSSVQAAELHQQQQRQRQKSLHRSTASECIIDLAEGTIEITELQSNLLDDGFSVQLHQAKRMTLSGQGGAVEASNTWEVLNATPAVTGPNPEVALAGATEPAQVFLGSSSTTTRFTATASATAQGSAGESALAAAHHSKVNPNAAGAPTRSSMRAPQPLLAPPPTRRSLRIVPSPARLTQQVTPNADQQAITGPTSADPPRRRGQSVQFTGVERLELQRLLVPTQVTHDSSDSTDGGEANT